MIDNNNVLSSYAAMIGAVLSEGVATRGANAAFAASAVAASEALDAGQSLSEIVDGYAETLNGLCKEDRAEVAAYAYGSKSSVTTHALLGYFLRINGDDIVADPRAVQGDLRRLAADAKIPVAVKIVKAAEDRKSCLTALRAAAKKGKAEKAAKEAAKEADKEAADNEADEAAESLAPSKASDDVTPEVVTPDEDAATLVPGVTSVAPEDLPTVRGERVEDLLVKVVGILTDGEPTIVTDESRKIIAALAAMVAQMPASV